MRCSLYPIPGEPFPGLPLSDLAELFDFREGRDLGVFGVEGALTRGSGDPSNSSPGRTSFRRAVPRLAYSLESSKPSHFRPSFLATTSEVALPAKGSSTNSPSCEEERMILPRSCSGIW